MAAIDERQLSDFKEIYRDPTGKTLIHFATYSDSGMQYPVAVKTILTQGMIEPYTYIEECMNQLKIEGKHVCKIFGWIVQPQKVMIVMEKMDGDLAKEVVERKISSRYFSEPELFRLCWDLVSVFSQMERLNMSHSDIKAENIFTNQESSGIVYKVGDFGSASIVRRKEHGITGTPLYLSPILKREYERYRQAQSKREFTHDAYKSDVFSLGVTLLMAAELQCPNDLLELPQLDQKLKAHLDHVYQLGYREFSNYLNWMLAIDETQRCTFTVLEAQLRRYDPLKEYIIAETEEPKDITEFEFLGLQEREPSLNLLEELNEKYRIDKLESVAMLLSLIKDQEAGQLLLCATLTMSYECSTCGSVNPRHPSDSETLILCSVCSLPIPAKFT